MPYPHRLLPVNPRTNTLFSLGASCQAPRNRPHFRFKFHLINKYRVIIKALARLEVNKQRFLTEWISTKKNLIPPRPSPPLHRKQQRVVFFRSLK
ncbi:MAG: hypothetical protein PHI06_10515, partial [Desulfobulbaceae bacterium]|nr:hypothetical protein [Desulfobulbaceae bacterium]